MAGSVAAVVGAGRGILESAAVLAATAASGAAGGAAEIPDMVVQVAGVVAVRDWTITVAGGPEWVVPSLIIWAASPSPTAPYKATTRWLAWQAMIKQPPTPKDWVARCSTSPASFMSAAAPSPKILRPTA